jgi:hypothetical protein
MLEFIMLAGMVGGLIGGGLLFASFMEWIND